jgi:hypothetical protein
MSAFQHAQLNELKLIAQCVHSLSLEYILLSVLRINGHAILAIAGVPSLDCSKWNSKKLCFCIICHLTVPYAEVLRVVANWDTTS